MHCLLFALLSKRHLAIAKLKSIRTFAKQYAYRDIIDEMPREKSQNAAKLGYENRKLNIIKYSSPNVRLEVVGSGAHGAPKSVHLFTDNCRYLFNCGEGTQRLANEFRIKIAKVPHVFVTYPSWENMSGLIGVALTVQNIGIPELYLHGHGSMRSVFSFTNKFVTLRKLSIVLQDSLIEKEFNDGILHIKYVHLYPSSSSKVKKNFSDPSLPTESVTSSSLGHVSRKNEKKKDDSYDESEDDIDYYEYLEREKPLKPHKSVKKHGNKRSQSNDCGKIKLPQEDHAVCYICRTKKVRGTLLYNKCIEFGVPPGPLLGLLKNGENVTLENGKIIKSSDVTTPETPGAIIIFLECPSEDYLDSLLKEPAFFEHQTREDNLGEAATVIVHFTSSALVKNPKYIDWMNRFPRETKHLFINEDSKSMGSADIHHMQFKLNLLHSGLFPLLEDSGIPLSTERHSEESPHKIIRPSVSEQKEMDNMEPITGGRVFLEDEKKSYSEKTFYKCENNPYIQGETLCEIYVRPKLGFDYSRCLVLRKKEVLDEVFSIESFTEELNKLKLELKELEQSIESDKREYPKILFLGTGSSQPSKRRNTSGILVFLDEKRSIILDCGEGTYTQLVRFYGKVKTKEILRNLSTIYVSHLHADHHLGLINLLMQRKMAFDEAAEGSREEFSDQKKVTEDGSYQKFKPVYLLAPVQLTRWLNLFSKEFEDISPLYHLLPNAYLVDRMYGVDDQNACFKSLNVKEIRTTPVDHCPNSFGVAITHNDGWKLTYSGDTRPCDNLVALGRNSDILIHEATMDDSLEVHARLKLHSTTSQAIEVGKKMKAKFILLTHFSQRYSHVPLFNESFTDDVGIAFDNMIVSINQLPILPKLKDVLKVMFCEKIELMQQKRKIFNKRKRKALESPDREMEHATNFSTYNKASKLSDD